MKLEQLRHESSQRMHLEEIKQQTYLRAEAVALVELLQAAGEVLHHHLELAVLGDLVLGEVVQVENLCRC